MSIIPYIPEEHKKYNILPYKREHGGEVFEYPSALLSRLEKIVGHDMMPYGYKSYEDYYSEIDRCAEPFRKDLTVMQLFSDYRAEIKRMNIKEEWSVCRYIGERMGKLMGLETGRIYYWPTTADHPIYRGVIDEEEFTSYWYPTEADDWEILEDPTGMAYRTLFGKKNHVSKKDFEYVMEQLRKLK